jgi:dolichol-phosphate mannosyltransferase
LVLLSTSIQTAFIGMLGEYIGRIFRNTRSLPAPIIDQRIEPVQTHDNATLVPDAATAI